MAISITRKVLAGFVLGLALLCVICVASYVRVTSVVRAGERIERTHQVLTQLERFFGTLTEATMATRGYVITGDESYLDAYHGAAPQMRETLETLRSSLAENPLQQKRMNTLQSLLDERLKLFADVVTARQFGGYEAAADIVRSKAGKELTDHIRTVVNEMAESGRQLLREQSLRQKTEVRTTLLTILFGSVLAIVHGAVALWVIRRDLRRRMEIEESLRESEARWRTILDAMPLPVVITRSSDSLILYANPSHALLMGLSLETLRGAKATQFYQDPQDRDGMLQIIRKNGRLRGYELRMKRGDATPFLTSMTLEPLNYQGEEGFLVVNPDYRDRIFLLFQRLHPQGTYSGSGIGLAVCKRIVERRIWVESEKGQGSTFCFTLPT